MGPDWWEWVALACSEGGGSEQGRSSQSGIDGGGAGRDDRLFERSGAPCFSLFIYSNRKNNFFCIWNLYTIIYRTKEKNNYVINNSIEERAYDYYMKF